MNLFNRELRESWRGLLGWSLGVAAVVLMYIPLFPSIGGAELMDSYMTMLPAEFSELFGLDRMTDGPGYTQATYFGLTAYLLLAIAAIGWGTAAVASREEDGSLELTLAHGVTRWQVFAEGALALLVRLAVLASVGSLLIWALNGSAQLNLDLGNLAAATLALFLVAALAGLSSLAAGAISGQRSVATAAGAFVAVAAYVLDAVAGIADVPWLVRISPYNWAFGQDPITTGFNGSGLLLLAAACALVVALGGWMFNRRDIGT